MSDGDLTADGGSFRDSVNRVYVAGDRILRGLDTGAAGAFSQFSNSDLATRLVASGALIASHELDPADDDAARKLVESGWAAVVEHQKIPFVSYPYEWSFSMLKDAALLHLRILEDALEQGWILKDATPYNIQWQGSRPVFIDIGSFERWEEGQPWVGYRQFCSLFLIPLMLKAHLGIDPRPILRSQLDGIPPMEAVRYFRGLDRLKRGVLAHVVFPATVEAAIVRRERDNVPARRRVAGRHSKAMVIGLVQGLRGTVRGLRSGVEHTDWSHYASHHSYADAEFGEKLAFVRARLGERRRKLVWDIGCNTGTFSRAASEFCDYVVALDRAAHTLDQQYISQRPEKGQKILTQAGDLANISPDQGWAGRERRALDGRGKPELVLCLALIHHMRVSANVPVPMFLDWLRSLDAEVIIEFVDRGDDMFVKLLANKTVDYPDYTAEAFETAVKERFTIRSREQLKGGLREIFHLAPA